MRGTYWYSSDRGANQHQSDLRGSQLRFEYRVGEVTYAQAKDAFEFRELDRIRVTGKTLAVGIYELLCPKGMLSDVQKDIVTAYGEGLRFFRGKDWDRAFACFEQASRVTGNDGDRNHTW